MKLSVMLLSLLLSCSLCSCAAPPAERTEALPMGGMSSSLPEETPEEISGEIHAPNEGDNVIPHEPNYYCGNTITTVRYTGGVGGPAEGTEEWEHSFWGSPSVELSDLLLFLDYSGDICRCLPEYEVVTEFSDTPYGVNLTDAYARHDGKQVSLTEEQVSLIQGIVDEIAAGEAGENRE